MKQEVGALANSLGFTVSLRFAIINDLRPFPFLGPLAPISSDPKDPRPVLFRIALQATRSTVPRDLQLSSLLHVERGDAS